jgi:hypothetical protein
MAEYCSRGNELVVGGRYLGKKSAESGSVSMLGAVKDVRQELGVNPGVQRGIGVVEAKKWW